MSPLLLPWKLDDKGWRFGSLGITQVLSLFQFRNLNRNLRIPNQQPKPAIEHWQFIGWSSKGCTVVPRFDRFHHLRFCVVTGAGGGYQWNGGSHWIWTKKREDSETWLLIVIYHCYKLHHLGSFAYFDLIASKHQNGEQLHAMCWDTKRWYH